MSERVYNVAVVGLRMGETVCQWVTDSPGVRLAALCDTNEERLRRTCDRFKVPGDTDYTRVLQRRDIDIVYLVTPSGMHAAMGIQAAQNGKNVIVAKPMDVSLENCDRLNDACAKAGVLLAVDFDGRFSDAQMQIHFAVERGMFGKLILGEARLKWYRSDDYYAAGGWRGTWQMDGGGSLANQTAHQIDQLLWHLGPVQSVTGADFGVFNHAKVESEDLGAALLRFKTGAIGAVLGTTTFPMNQYAGLEIHGTEGGVLTTQAEPQWIFRDPNRREQLQRTSEVKTTAQDMALVLNGQKDRLLCDGEAGRRSVELLTAIYRSAKERCEVRLPL